MAGPDAQATHAQARTGAPGATVRSYGMGSPAVAGMRGSQGAPPGTPGAFPGTADAWAHAQQVAAVQAAAAQMAQARHLQMPPEKKRRRWPVILVLLLILACLVTALVLALTWQPAKSAREGTAGQLEGKTAEEIQAELDRVVDEGMFNISIASTIQLADGASPAELRIENVPGNRYLMRVAITLDDTGEQVYATELIEPNFHIQQDVLDVELKAGTYPATALFTAYDPATEEPVGQAAAKVAIAVAA